MRSFVVSFQFFFLSMACVIGENCRLLSAVFWIKKKFNMQITNFNACPIAAFGASLAIYIPKSFRMKQNGTTQYGDYILIFYECIGYWVSVQCSFHQTCYVAIIPCILMQLTWTICMNVARYWNIILWIETITILANNRIWIKIFKQNIHDEPSAKGEATMVSNTEYVWMSTDSKNQLINYFK